MFRFVTHPFSVLFTVLLSIGGSVFAGSPSNQATALDELLTDIDAARDFDYCEWRFSQKQADVPPGLDALIEQEDDDTKGLAASLVKAGTTIATNSKKKKTCEKAFATATESYEKERNKALTDMRVSAFMVYSKDEGIARVQKAVVQHWVEDQAARQVYIKSDTKDRSGAPYWKRQLSVIAARQADTNSTHYLQKVLEQYDWIDIHRFGKQVSANAWILVQHADRNPAFQKEVLARMEKYVDNGGVSKQNYAYLWDRVAVNHDQLQRYGTQPDWNCNDDGTLDFKPMEDPETVDQRRAEMGLGPAQRDLDQMAKSVCRGG